MKYAFVKDDIAIDVVSSDPFMLFVESYAAQFIEVPDKVFSGWVLNEDEWLESQPLPIYVPQEVSMRQARLELLALNKLSFVQPAIDSIQDATQKQAAQIEWDYSSSVRIDHPFVMGLGLMMNLDLDKVFTEASKR